MRHRDCESQLIVAKFYALQGVFERLARGIKGVGDSVKGESGKEFLLHPK